MVLCFGCFNLGFLECIVTLNLWLVVCNLVGGRVLYFAFGFALSAERGFGCLCCFVLLTLADSFVVFALTCGLNCLFRFTVM